MTRFKTIFNYMNNDDRLDELFYDAMQWAVDNNIKKLYSCAYLKEITYKFEDTEDLTAFTLKFGELME